MVLRIVTTIIALIVYSSIGFLHNTSATLIEGKIAGMQLENSDASYIIPEAAFSFFSGTGLWMTMFLILLLAAIWFVPAKRLLTTASVILIGYALLHGSPAKAYFDQRDVAEAYTILPNESAFWIPDVGDNRSSQARLDSEEYLRANKIATKRFIVPHTKLNNSGGCALCWDAYVPTGRLIIVDRTPYSREWVDSSERGTSARKEGFPCQSAEGLNITAGISIGASVSEENSPKFLYRFGVLPPKGDRTDPKTIFTSVYYGRSLEQVMDDVARKEIQTIVCREISARAFDKANAEANKIMDTVHQEANKYLASVGVTLEFIGWADTFMFDHDVQSAINRVYIAKQDMAVAEMLTPYIPTIRAMAAAEALRIISNKFNGALPSTVVGLPPEVGALFETFAKSAKDPVRSDHSGGATQ